MDFWQSRLIIMCRRGWPARVEPAMAFWQESTRDLESWLRVPCESRGVAVPSQVLVQAEAPEEELKPVRGGFRMDSHEDVTLRFSETELRIDGLIMCSARNTIGAGTYRRAK